MANDLLQRALTHFRAGQLDAAAKLLDSHLKRRPADVDALYLRGLVALNCSDATTALVWLERAVAADDDHAIARLHRGRTRLIVGDLPGAITDLTRVVDERPDLEQAFRYLVRAHLRADNVLQAERLVAPISRSTQSLDNMLLLAEVRLAAGRAAEALALLRDAPNDHADAALIRGQCLSLLGQHRPALGLLRQLAEATNAAPAWQTLAAAAERAGDRATLREALDTILRLTPSVEAELNLATAALADGEPDVALAAALRATTRAPGDGHALVTLADALMIHPAPPPEIATALAAALAHPDVDAQRLDRATRAVLAADPPIAAWLAGDDTAAPALIAHPAFAPWLRRAVVLDPRWESRLRALREALVTDVAAGQPVSRGALIGLAMHAFHTEHCWPQTPAEAEALATLQPRAIAALRDEHSLGGDVAIAALAALTPLEPLAPPRPTPPASVAPLVTTLVDDWRTEVDVEQLKLAGDASQTRDATSEAVRAQYEAHPYPRLVSVQRRQLVRLADRVATLAPDRPLRVPAEPTILVAGAGTGQHPLTTALTFHHTSILAIDLSRRSLARAQLAAARLGITSIRFAQCDLLALASLDETYDFVESVGVLHHLADPLAGWRVLVDRTRPGGIMRIGLYSGRARAPVLAARAELAALRLPPTDDGLRAAREHLRALPDDHPAHTIIYSPDFTSLSGVRDLVMHPCERHFSPSSLGRALGGLGLDFLGFQHADPSVPRRYAERFPSDQYQRDLTQWEAFEGDHPQVFAGMMIAWCWRR